MSFLRQSSLKKKPETEALVKTPWEERIRVEKGGAYVQEETHALNEIISELTPIIVYAHDCRYKRNRIARNTALQARSHTLDQWFFFSWNIG